MSAARRLNRLSEDHTNRLETSRKTSPTTTSEPNNRESSVSEEDLNAYRAKVRIAMLQQWKDILKAQLKQAEDHVTKLEKDLEESEADVTRLEDQIWDVEDEIDNLEYEYDI